MCTLSAKGRLNLSWTQLTQSQSTHVLPAMNLLLQQSAPGERQRWLGSSRWKRMNCKVVRRTGLLSGQQCSLPLQCEPRCWHPSDSAGWGNQGTSREVVEWPWNWCSLCFQCYLPGGIWNIGPRRCSWAPGNLKLLLACQEPSVCCYYFPTADETLHRIPYFTSVEVCSLEELE